MYRDPLPQPGGEFGPGVVGLATTLICGPARAPAGGVATRSGTP